jgi:hypothetical protein
MFASGRRFLLQTSNVTHAFADLFQLRRKRTTSRREVILVAAKKKKKAGKKKK